MRFVFCCLGPFSTLKAVVIFLVTSAYYNACSVARDVPFLDNKYYVSQNNDSSAGFLGDFIHDNRGGLSFGTREALGNADEDSFIDKKHFLSKSGKCPECLDNTFLEDLRFCTNCGYGAPNTPQQQSQGRTHSTKASQLSQQADLSHSQSDSVHEAAPKSDRQDRQLRRKLAADDVYWQRQIWGGQDLPPVRNQQGYSRRKSKEFITEQHRQWRQKNTERAYEIGKHWRERNRERAREHHARWRRRHPEQLEEYRQSQRESQKRMREHNRERIKAYHRRWQQKNKERRRQSHREWRAKNPERLKIFAQRAKDRKRQSREHKQVGDQVDHSGNGPSAD